MGRSSVRFDEMVRLDLQVRLLVDSVAGLQDLAATPRAVIKGSGAY